MADSADAWQGYRGDDEVKQATEREEVVDSGDDAVLDAQECTGPGVHCQHSCDIDAWDRHARGLAGVVRDPLIRTCAVRCGRRSSRYNDADEP